MRVCQTIIFLIQKQLLNSCWGKLCEKAERSEVRYTHDARSFHDLFTDQSLEVIHFEHLNEQMDRCVVRKREPYVRAPATNCLSVACFVTAYARLHLWEKLEQYRLGGGRPLYSDTDSIIGVRPAHLPAPIQPAEWLGEMKREMPGRRLIEHGSGGGKQRFALHVDAETGGDLRADVHIRGLELNYSAEQLLRFPRLRQLVIREFGRQAQTVQV